MSRDLAMPAITAGSVAAQQARRGVAVSVVAVLLAAGLGPARADESGPKVSAVTAPRWFEQSEKATPLAPPIDVDDYVTPQPQIAQRQANFQPPPGTPQLTRPLVVQAPEAIPVPAQQSDPCSQVVEKPLGALGINIAIPTGDVPTDHGTVCLASMNTAAVRSFPTYNYQWDATCFCHRPLYFEEINLERYGYGCGCCLQPLASAAHFFGTVPALPYCMAADCPHECVYTLGHYRPGSCPPWRCHWPPADPIAAAAEGGVWTGMIFLIP
jgi:hypothetical protein